MNLIPLDKNQLEIIVCILTILSSLFTFLYYRDKWRNTKLSADHTEECSKKFIDLVEKLDIKVSAFSNFLLSRIDSSKNTNISILDNAFSYNAIDINKSKHSNLSLFNYRSNHYAAEKVRICKLALNSILSNKDLNKYKKVILLIDSGSTVFPIFELLCNSYWNKKYNELLSKVDIYTNNIPGVTSLINCGRKGNDFHADMVYDCHVLPGIAEGKYSAILGPDGPSHLAHLLKSINKDNTCIIAIITGNYISIKDGILWRGNHHGQLKNAIIDFSDYLYILTPLGKIFPEPVNKINDFISGTTHPLAPDKEYRNLLDKEANNIFNAGSSTGNEIVKFVPSRNNYKNIYIVTTERSKKGNDIYPRELLTYFSSIFDKLKDEFGEYVVSNVFSPNIESEQVINELKLFNDPNEAFLNYEFPHPEIRSHMRDSLFN